MAFASGTVLPRCVSVRGWVDFLTVDFGLFWSMNSRHGWKDGGGATVHSLVSQVGVGTFQHWLGFPATLA